MEITALDSIGAVDCACLGTFAVISLGVLRLVARGEKKPQQKLSRWFAIFGPAFTFCGFTWRIW